jgi:hypothetical protein
MHRLKYHEVEFLSCWMKLEARESFYRGPTVGAKIFWWTFKGGDNCIDSIENMNNFCIQEKMGSFTMMLILLFVEFLFLIVTPDHGGFCAIMVGVRGLTPPPPCHYGDSGWLLLLYNRSWGRFHIWVVAPSGEGDALRVWRLLPLFSAKSFIWIAWVRKLGHLAIGSMLLIFGP